MAEPDEKPVKLEELLVSSLAQTDALAKLLIEKGLITREEFMYTTTLRGSSNTLKPTLGLAAIAAIWGLWASLSIIPAEKAEE
jgi:hypothetical protein